jgi:excisionase family DNA binding protein
MKASEETLQSSASTHPGPTEWLTATEAAQHLKVETRTLLLWVRQGKVRGYKLSGTKRHVWRFQRADLDSVLFGNPNGS